MALALESLESPSGVLALNMANKGEYFSIIFQISY